MIPFEIIALIDDEEEHEKLGSCGCTDYHMADCPTRTGSYEYNDEPNEPDEEDEWYE